MRWMCDDHRQLSDTSPITSLLFHISRSPPSSQPAQSSVSQFPLHQHHAAVIQYHLPLAVIPQLYQPTRPVQHITPTRSSRGSLAPHDHHERAHYDKAEHVSISILPLPFLVSPRVLCPWFVAVSSLLLLARHTASFWCHWRI